MSETDRPPPQPKWRFDPTINLGHMLTFIGFLATIFIGWSTLDKRVTVLEERRISQAEIDRRQDEITASNLSAIRESLNDIKAALVRLQSQRERP